QAQVRRRTPYSPPSHLCGIRVGGMMLDPSPTRPPRRVCTLEVDHADPKRPAVDLESAQPAWPPAANGPHAASGSFPENAGGPASGDGGGAAGCSGCATAAEQPRGSVAEVAHQTQDLDVQPDQRHGQAERHAPG